MIKFSCPNCGEELRDEGRPNDGCSLCGETDPCVWKIRLAGGEYKNVAISDASNIHKLQDEAAKHGLSPQAPSMWPAPDWYARERARFPKPTKPVATSHVVAARPTHAERSTTAPSSAPWAMRDIQPIVPSWPPRLSTGLVVAMLTIAALVVAVIFVFLGVGAPPVTQLAEVAQDTKTLAPEGPTPAPRRIEAMVIAPPPAPLPPPPVPTKVDSTKPAATTEKLARTPVKIVARPASESDPEPEHDPDYGMQPSAKELNVKGLEAARAGDHKAALRFYLRSIKMDSESVWPRYNAACEFALAGQAGAAIAQLKKIQQLGGPDAMKALRLFRTDKDFDPIREHPDLVRLFGEYGMQPSAKELNVKGLEAARAGDHKAALRFYLQSIKMDSESVWPRYNAACEFALAGQVGAAIAQLKKIQQLGGPDAMKALRSFRTDKDFDPIREHPDLVGLFGETRLEAPASEASVDSGKKQPRPVDIGAQYRARGVSAFQAGELDSAKHFLQMAIASNPEDAEARRVLNKVRKVLGESDAP